MLVPNKGGGQMALRVQGMTMIVIPTGRGGCCCIIPLTLLLTPFGVVGITLLVRMWRLMRNRVSGTA